MKVDLHCHSSMSDGALAPAAVVERAAARGVGLLALTDHDRLDGLAEARAAARRHGLSLIDGVEVSTTWRGVSVHVVGLAVDPANAALAQSLERLRAGRIERGRRIAQALEKAGIPDAFEGAAKYAARPESLSRTHFARYLVETGAASDVRDVFRRYLAAGKPGHVAHRWAALDEAVRWIRGAGGVAVLAHPGRYPFGADALRALIEEFRDHGGAGIEVACASHSAGQVREFAELARHYGLAASCGSDFHAPGEGAELGEVPALDVPVRALWRDDAIARAGA